nr:hypothetical protein [Microctonus hyperodae filamentous virus]
MNDNFTKTYVFDLKQCHTTTTTTTNTITNIDEYIGKMKQYAHFNIVYHWYKIYQVATNVNLRKQLLQLINIYLSQYIYITENQ